MSTRHSLAPGLAIFTAIAVSAGLIGHLSASTADPARPVVATDRWAVVAPATVEPAGGAAHVSAELAGRIDGIYAHVGDSVEAGALIAELTNVEQRARLKAADVEVAFRKAERDQAVLDPEGAPVRAAEDAVYNAALAIEHLADQIDEARRKSASPHAQEVGLANLQADLAQAKQTRAQALAQLEEHRRAFPHYEPSRTDSALATARSEREIARAQLEKTLIRAPVSGTILQLDKVTGDSLDASASDVFAVIGDISHLRLRAEVSERRLGRIAVGQAVTVRSDAFSREFHGRVTSIGMNAVAKQLAVRANGALPVDHVIDVLVALEDATRLVPGMLVDAYFQAKIGGASFDEAK